MILERVSASLRGELTRWMLEPQAGVFVGSMSAVVRDRLWEEACAKMRGGAGMLIHNSESEQGFSMQFWGLPDRRIEDFEGLWLVRMPSE